MSKSKGNVVVPDEYIAKFGADTLRMYLMFLGPFNQGGDFYDTGVEGMYRFLKRVWRLISEHLVIAIRQLAEKQSQAIASSPPQGGTPRNDMSRERNSMMHKTIKKVTEDISNLRYNTAIAAMMEWYNYLSAKLKAQSSKLTVEEAETFLKLLAPFAPHVTEELWQRLRRSQIHAEQYAEIRRNSVVQRSVSRSSAIWSVHLQPWPTYNPKFLEEDEVTIVVQVNGKVRDTFQVQSSKFKVQSYIEQLARKSNKVSKYLEGKEVKKVVYVEGKVINFVVE
jgi:leucyl-tRNA synthetase